MDKREAAIIEKIQDTQQNKHASNPNSGLYGSPNSQLTQSTEANFFFASKGSGASGNETLTFHKDENIGFLHTQLPNQSGALSKNQQNKGSSRVLSAPHPQYVETESHDDEIDLYGDLESSVFQPTQPTLNNPETLQKVEDLIKDRSELKRKVVQLTKENTALTTNISTLFKTAKCDIDKKNFIIQQLQKKLKNLTMANSQNSTLTRLEIEENLEQCREAFAESHSMVTLAEIKKVIGESLNVRSKNNSGKWSKSILFGNMSIYFCKEQTPFTEHLEVVSVPSRLSEADAKVVTKQGPVYKEDIEKKSDPMNSPKDSIIQGNTEIPELKITSLPSSYTSDHQSLPREGSLARTQNQSNQQVHQTNFDNKGRRNNHGSYSPQTGNHNSRHRNNPYRKDKSRRSSSAEKQISRPNEKNDSERNTEQASNYHKNRYESYDSNERESGSQNGNFHGHGSGNSSSSTGYHPRSSRHEMDSTKLPSKSGSRDRDWQHRRERSKSKNSADEDSSKSRKRGYQNEIRPSSYSSKRNDYNTEYKKRSRNDKR